MFARHIIILYYTPGDPFNVRHSSFQKTINVFKISVTSLYTQRILTLNTYLYDIIIIDYNKLLVCDLILIDRKTK